MNKLLSCLVFLSFNLIDGTKCCERMWMKNEQSESYRGRYGNENGKTFEVVIPRKVRSDGVFVSHQIPHHYKRSFYRGKKRNELTPEDAVHYRVSIDGKEYHLELYPNHHLIGPGAVLEERKKSPTGNFLDNDKFRKLRDTQCHYHGHVREHRDLTALSTCNGLSGYIKTRSSVYLIEPLENPSYDIEGEHPHIVYRQKDASPDARSTFRCNTTDIPMVRNIVPGKLIKRDTDEIVNRGYTIELLVVLDKPLLDFHRSRDVENYILTLFNMAAGLFQDVSLGVEMELTIVRIIRLEIEENEMNIAVNKDIESTLKHFQTWQKKMNPGDDTHPNHHDTAILLTKIDICITQNLCAFTGTSTIAGTCDSLRGAIIVQDNGLRTGYEITHHLGHSIGMSHDVQEENGCPGIIHHQSGYTETTVMYSGYHYVTKRWSKCSQNYVKLYIESGLAKCLKDEAADHHFPSIEMLPGVMYGADDQCRLIYHPDARQCDVSATCDKLRCSVPGMGCVAGPNPPAEGTTCGEKRWCYKMKCLTVGERPSAIDGGWNSWSTWSHCSRTCGSGVAYSTRKCNHPAPSRGGLFCTGDWKRHKICATQPCEIGAPSFRDVQCSEFNDWVFPEDGKVHQWIGYNLPENLKASENPCVLYCLSETKLLTSLKTKVVDGTTCYRGIRDICVGGVCREIPCDLDMESDAIEDMCGVCRGDSTSCVLKEGIINIEQGQRLKKILEVPVGTKNIRVEETHPTKSRIIVRNKKTKAVLIDGNRLGMFDVPGSKAWLGMIRAKQEALNIPGPVTARLIILVYPRENVTVKFSMGLKSEKAKKPAFEWSFISWSRCSAPCGPGEMISKPSCVEKIGGQVDNRFCKNITKPEVKVRPCNQAPCVPRWMIGDWQGCVPCTGNCKKTRAVKCIRPVGDGEQEADVIADGYCQGPKPKESASEVCRERRDASYDSRSINEAGMKKKREDGMSRGMVGTLEKCEKEMMQIPHESSFKRNAKRARLAVGSKRKRDDELTGVVSVKKGQVIIDREDINNLTLTIILERDDNNAIVNFPKDFKPQPADNLTEFTLKGMDAVHYVKRLQEDKTISELPPL